MKTIPLLKAKDIEIKIKQVCENGAIALLYKTARVDMSILDEVFGAENWETDYREIKGNLYCGIGVFFPEQNRIVWKWDCGIESREDGEGNEKKGEASDSFKRAGVKWGIGRELYTAPFIFLNVPTKKNEKGKYELVNRFQSFSVKSIEYDGRNIKSVVIIDDNGKIVYGDKSEPKTETKPKSDFMSLDEALKFEFEIKGKTYKVGDCTDEQLVWIRNNMKDENLIKAVNMVFIDRTRNAISNQ